MTDKREEMERALTVIPGSALPTILANDPDDILGKIAAKVAAFKPDASTPSGRDEMRSLAYEIAKAKMSLVKIGKGLTEGWRASTKAVNAECNTIESRMDELRDKVRAPLTAWENAEKDRVAQHENAIALIYAMGDVPAEWTADQISERVQSVANTSVMTRNWQEFEQRAKDAVTSIGEQLRAMHSAAIKREQDAAELAVLREAEARREKERQEQERIAREAKIAAEAAERAKIDAEAKAAQEAAAVERQRIADREAADKREREAAEALAKAEREKEAAELRVKEAEAKAERDRIAAINAERQRIAEMEAAKKREDDRRAADMAHRASVNREVLAAIVKAVGVHIPNADDAGMICKSIVVAIAKGDVPHTTINY